MSWKIVKCVTTVTLVFTVVAHENSVSKVTTMSHRRLLLDKNENKIEKRRGTLCGDIQYSYESCNGWKPWTMRPFRIQCGNWRVSDVHFLTYISSIDINLLRSKFQGVGVQSVPLLVHFKLLHIVSNWSIRRLKCIELHFLHNWWSVGLGSGLQGLQEQ